MNELLFDTKLYIVSSHEVVTQTNDIDTCLSMFGLDVPIIELIDNFVRSLVIHYGIYQ